MSHKKPMGHKGILHCRTVCRIWTIRMPGEETCRQQLAPQTRNRHSRRKRPLLRALLLAVVATMPPERKTVFGRRLTEWLSEGYEPHRGKDRSVGT